MLPMSSAESATRVSHPTAFFQRLHANSRQWDTSPRIAPPVVALAVAATVVRRVTWPRSATSPRTCQRSSAATATSTATPAASARSPATVSLVSPDLNFYMLTLLQILGSSARTARSTATPRSAVPSLTLTRTVELVPTMVASTLWTPLLTVVMAVATGTAVVVMQLVPVGKLVASSFSTHSATMTPTGCDLIERCESASTRPGTSGIDG